MTGRRFSPARLASAPQVAAIAMAVLVVLAATVVSALLAPGADGGAATAATSPATPTATATVTTPPGRGARRPARNRSRPPAPRRTHTAPATAPVPDSIQHQAEIPGRAVSITIDDGPDPRWTPQILDLLRRNHVHATFCMIGPQARAHPELVRRVVAEGHRLCDHTVHHDTTMDRKPLAYQRAEILDALGMIEEASGGAPVRYYRAPGGAFTPASRALAARYGMRPLGWNIDSTDFTRPGVAVIVATVKGEIHNGPTVLFHDGGGDRAQTVAALGQCLTWLRQEGYAFSFPKVD